MKRVLPDDEFDAWLTRFLPATSARSPSRRPSPTTPTPSRATSTGCACRAPGASRSWDTAISPSSILPPGCRTWSAGTTTASTGSPASPRSRSASGHNRPMLLRSSSPTCLFLRGNGLLQAGPRARALPHLALAARLAATNPALLRRRGARGEPRRRVATRRALCASARSQLDPHFCAGARPAVSPVPARRECILDVLERIHRHLRPRTYVEIGVETGASHHAGARRARWRSASTPSPQLALRAAGRTCACSPRPATTSSPARRARRARRPAGRPGADRRPAPLRVRAARLHEPRAPARRRGRPS